MKRIHVAMVILAAVAVVGPVHAQEFWEKKPYTEWNKEQVKKLLENSPWAGHQGARDVQNLAFTGGSTAGEESERRIDYYAQIRSALPIRQAVIRRAMIDGKYDKMSAEQKKAFDESAAAYLSREYADVIVIAVEYSSNIDTYDRELAKYWQSVTPEAIPVNVYLIGHNNVRVPPMRYTAERGASRSFQLIFPREFNGQPVVSPEDKVFRLEIPTPIAPDATPGSGSRGLIERRALFEFKLEKMKYKGQLVF